MSMVSGIQGHLLEVTIVGCSRLKDTEWISRQDPYVCLEYATTKFRSRTCTDGGKHPIFQEKTNIPLIEGLREIVVTVWNSNTLIFDDFIGSGRVQLQKVLSQGYDDSSWPLQSKSGKFAGEVKLIMHYPNAQKAHKPAATSYAPPAPTYVGATAPYAPAPTYTGATAAYAPPPIGYPPMKSVEAPPSYHPTVEVYPHTSSILYPASSAYTIRDPTTPYPPSSTYPTSDPTAPYPLPTSPTYPCMTNYPLPQQTYPPPSYPPQTYPQLQQHAYPPGPFPGFYPPPTY